MSFVEAIKSGFQKFGEIGGRASRSEYWYFTLFIFLISTPLNFAIPLLGEKFAIVLSIIFSIMVLPPCITVSVRRYHDIGISGFWFLGLLTLGLGPWFYFSYMISTGSSNYDLVFSENLDFGILSGICYIIHIGICLIPSSPNKNEWGLSIVGETKTNRSRNQNIEENDLETQLVDAKALFEKNLISEREYEKLKEKILGIE